MAGKMLNSLNDLFVAELNDALDAEQQTTKALPKMADVASSPRLKQNLHKHLKQTQDQIRLIEQIFSKLSITPEPEHCDGMAGIIKDGEKMLQMKGAPAVIDAAIIAASQKVEHYEISTYGTLRTFAQTLGHDDIARMLQTILDQESDTDELLTDIATTSINKKAA